MENNKSEMTPKDKALQLLDSFMQKSYKMGDHSMIYTPTALLHAIMCCDEVLGYMGADRGTQFWIEVKEELKKL